MGGLTLGSTGSWAQVTTFDYTGAERFCRIYQI